MAKRKTVRKKTPPNKPGRLQDGVTWRLSDPGMGLLERAGLAALYMSLRAAEELGVKDELAPLTWSESDLTSDSVTVRSTADDKSALTKLFEWAWQVREGVLYFPGIHRSLRDRDNFQNRVDIHNGVLGTFLQHNKSRLNSKTKEKATIERRIVALDDDVLMSLQYQRLSFVKPYKDLPELFDRNGRLVNDEVKLSSWVRPGMTNRYPTDASSWTSTPCRGDVVHAILWMLAPIVCFYQQIQGTRKTKLDKKTKRKSRKFDWVVAIPDVRDLEAFDAARLFMRLDAPLTGSPADTIAQCLVESWRQASRIAHIDFQAFWMGQVKYYKNQTVRKGVVASPTSNNWTNSPNPAKRRSDIRRFRRLRQVMATRYVSVRDSFPLGPTGSPDPCRSLSMHRLPAARGLIANNIVHGRSWYDSLLDPPVWELPALEQERDRLKERFKVSWSLHRIWLYLLQTFQQEALVALIHDSEFTDDDDQAFIDAFWDVLSAVYQRERRAVEAQYNDGKAITSDEIGRAAAYEREHRSYDESAAGRYLKRRANWNDKIARRLSQAKTRHLTANAISELFLVTRNGYESNAVQRQPDIVTKLIHDRHHWKRALNLARIALVSWTTRKRRQTFAEDNAT